MEHQTLKNNATNKQPAFSSLMEHQTLENNATRQKLERSSVPVVSISTLPESINKSEIVIYSFLA
jgi:hypothetical protein